MFWHVNGVTFKICFYVFKCVFRSSHVEKQEKGNVLFYLTLNFLAYMSQWTCSQWLLRVPSMKGAIVVYVLIHALEVGCCSTAGKQDCGDSHRKLTVSGVFLLLRHPIERFVLNAVQGWNHDYQALKMVPINCCCHEI